MLTVEFLYFQTPLYYFFLSQPVLNGKRRELFVINFIIFVSSRFQATLLAIHHFEHDSNIFEAKAVSLKFLLKIMTPVSTASITLSDTYLLLKIGRLSYGMKSKGRRIDT